MKYTLLLLVATCAGATEFAVASIKANQFGNSGAEGSELEKTTLSPTSVILHNVTLRSCLQWAYGVRDSQLTGPGWMASEHFDIAANTSAPASAAEMKQMMRALLTSRFRLQMRKELKQLPVYEMTARARTWTAAADESIAPSLRPVDGMLVFRNFSMGVLAERLADRPFQFDRLVMDRTGIDGAFDFSLKLADNANNLKHTLEGMERENGNVASMLTVLREQLGLTFRPAKASIESLVIDHAEKVPTGN